MHERKSLLQAFPFEIEIFWLGKLKTTELALFNDVLLSHIHAHTIGKVSIFWNRDCFQISTVVHAHVNGSSNNDPSSKLLWQAQKRQ